MAGRGGWSEIRLPLAALAIVCVLTAGCTPDDGDSVPQASPTAVPHITPAPTPTPITQSVGSLAYGRDGDIYVADWDGSNPFRIVDGRSAKNCRGLGEYWGEGPIWSPDGRYLAFRHTDCHAKHDKWWNAVVSDRKGNIVASIPSEGWRIAWSPDSTHVAVWVRWGETIGVYGLDGVRQTVLTVPSGWMPSGDLDPVWSRDGEALLLPEGVVIPVDGSSPRHVPMANHRRESWATFSPDGSRLAYPLNGSVAVVDADGSSTHESSSPWFGWVPVWSPNGDQIAFVSPDGHELRVFDVASETTKLLAKDDTRYGLCTIEYSPEGDRILFARLPDPGSDSSSLWSVNADGSDLRRLVDGTIWGDWRSHL
jgi:Tol biopolymer transport system component